jgi:hypothetical protein
MVVKEDKIGRGFARAFEDYKSRLFELKEEEDTQ